MGEFFKMYDIRLKQIECFLDIAQTLSFTATAKRLRISQPLTSKWIKSLEEELDTQLFIRSKDGLSLTAEGAFLSDRWRDCFTDLVGCISEMQALGDHTKQALSIGILDRYESDSFIHDILHSFEDRYPAYQIRVSSHGIQELIDRLIGHNLDVAFHTTLDADTQEGINFYPLRTVDFYIAISNQHRLARRDHLTIEDLKHESFFSISEAESPSSSKRIISQCQRAGFTPRNLQYVPNLSSLALSIIYQNGVTLTTAEIANGYERQIKLYPLPGTTKEESIALLWRKQDPGDDAIRFVEYVNGYIHA